MACFSILALLSRSIAGGRRDEREPGGSDATVMARAVIPRNIVCMHAPRSINCVLNSIRYGSMIHLSPSAQLCTSASRSECTVSEGVEPGVAPAGPHPPMRAMMTRRRRGPRLKGSARFGFGFALRLHACPPGLLPSTPSFAFARTKYHFMAGAGRRCILLTP
jgi:hypothetical protein